MLLIRLPKGSDIPYYVEPVEISKLILEYIRVLIWPIVISGFLVYFRKNVGSFFDRVLKFKFAGGEFEAESQIKKEQQELLKSTEIKTSNSNESIEELKEQLEFEKIFGSIFGSQIRLLEILLPKSNGESRMFLENYFNEIKNIFINVFSNWSLDNYLQYLIGYKLIEMTSEGNYKIAQKGINFLSYITSQNYLKTRAL